MAKKYWTFFPSSVLALLLLLQLLHCPADGATTAAIPKSDDHRRRRHIDVATRRPLSLRFGRRSSNVDDGRPLFGVVGTTTAKASTATATAAVDGTTLLLRGGACSDSTPRLFAKVAASAAVESGLMYSLVQYAAGVYTSSDNYSLAIVKTIQAGILLLVIFGSASFGAIIDNGLSAATRQLIDPNTIPGDEDWYANLKKPNWNPPGWLFPIMWLIVSKPTQFMAVWKLITQNYDVDLTVPLAVYCIHLSLGDAWNKVFFGLECTGRGLAVILGFYGMLLSSAYLFYGVDKYAGLLLVPTCLWVTVATALNLSIYLLNKDDTCCD